MSAILLRPYQRTAREKFLEGIRRQLLVWHRRAGKDIYGLDLASDEATDHVGTYWHLYPTHVQARRAIWNGIDNRDGVRFLERAFPSDTRAATRSQDMQIELKNGSMWQLCGSDKFDALVGSNPLGVVVSELALCDPRALDYIRPILRENNGWLVLITTYRGRNHAYRMTKRLAANPKWFVDVRTVEDTTDNDGNRILSDQDIQDERDEGMSEALIRQEYYCDPVAALPGSIYGNALEKLIEAGRLGSFSYDSSLPVLASWSLEFDEQYTVIFSQTRGNESRIIGSHSYPFESLSDALQQARQAFPWRYIARHIVPHGTPPEMLEVFENNSQVVDPAPDISNAFSVTRDTLATTYVDNAPRAWEDERDNNEYLIDALNGYRFTESRAGGSYTNTPVNSWEKHFARAFETYSAFRHSEPADVSGWHPPPDYRLQDRAVI